MRKQFNRHGRAVLATLALVVAAVLVAPPAMAVYWYSESAPLKVYQDGAVQGYAYGNFKNYEGVSARSYSWQKDAKPGGDGIYVETEFYFYKICQISHSAPTWCSEGEKSTDNTTSGSWIKLYTAKYLDMQSSQARGSIYICENHSWAPDACSDSVIRSFTY